MKAGSNPTPRPVAFVHIPKAAGTTLHGILARQYSAGHTLILDVQRPGYRRHLDAVTEQQWASALCLRGHMPFGMHRRTGRDFAYVTVLRDPVTRIVSKYRNLKRRPERAREMAFPLDRLETLEDFIALQGERNAMNFQTRMLAGWVEPDAPLFPYPQPLPDEALDLAKANIEKHFAVVGLQERFVESVALMQLALGWRQVGIPRRNAAPAGSDRYDLAVHDEIRELNHLDQALVVYAAQRLDEQIAAAGEDFERALMGIKSRSRVAENLQKFVRGSGLRRVGSLVRKLRVRTSG